MNYPGYHRSHNLYSAVGFLKPREHFGTINGAKGLQSKFCATGKGTDSVYGAGKILRIADEGRALVF